ncbi:hypothetical protein [Oricola sp.]|uniref:hypothetical protein n=1 Tax=Oricola sp. TaxID=1979950 RepID=UPI003BA9B19C
MKIASTFVVAIVIALAAPGTSASDSTPARKGKVSLREEIIGHSFKYWINGDRGTITYRSRSATARSIQGWHVRGRLRISGDKICIRYREIRAGQEQCFSVTRTPTGYKTSHGGRLEPL